jgi:D-alanyl-D-alanine carboxypeptidase
MSGKPVGAITGELRDDLLMPRSGPDNRQEQGIAVLVRVNAPTFVCNASAGRRRCRVSVATRSATWARSVACVAALLVVVSGCHGGGPRSSASASSASSTTTPTQPPGPTQTMSPSSPVSRAFPAPATAPASRRLATRLPAVLQKFADQQGYGMTAALVTPTGTWSGAAGADGDGKALLPSAVMGIGDVTMTFVAAEVLALARAGKIDLDAPLSRYVRLPFDRYGATVRQALAMRSGFPEHDTNALVAAALADPARHFTPSEALAFAIDPPSRPGTYSYCYTNFIVLGLLIEKVTGRPLAEALRADLLRPAGLPRVTTQDAEQPASPRAAPGTNLPLGPPSPYLPNRAGASLAWAASGMTADAASVARWGYLLYGSRILPVATVKMMTTLTASHDDLYGLGTTGLQIGGHPAVGYYGQIIGFTALVAAIPDRQLSLAVLISSYRVDTQPIADALAAAALSSG